MDAFFLAVFFKEREILVGKAPFFWGGESSEGAAVIFKEKSYMEMRLSSSDCKKSVLPVVLTGF